MKNYSIRERRGRWESGRSGTGKIARLPLEFAILEQAKKNPTGDRGVFAKANGKWEVRTDIRSRIDPFTDFMYPGRRHAGKGVEYLAGRISRQHVSPLFTRNE